MAHPPRRAVLFAALLVAPVAGSLQAARFENEFPFSNAQNAAQYLNDFDYSQPVLIGTFPSYSTTALIPHLESHVPGIYFIEYAENRTYMTWDTEFTSRWIYNDAQVVSEFRGLFFRGNYTQGLLVFNHPYPESRLPLVASYTGAVHNDGDYYFYLMDRNS